jgi:hypothetical protein
VQRVNAEGLPFNFYLHPWEIDPDQPRVKTNLLSRLRHYTNLKVCMARLEDLVQRFEFGTMIDVLGATGLMPQAAPHAGIQEPRAPSVPVARAG